jgi:tetratricopeptide (TPR) repeat protein
MAGRTGRYEHLVLLLVFPGLILLGIVVERTWLAPRVAARPPAEEVAIWRSLVERHPEFGAAQLRLGQALAKEGDHQGAIAACRRALQLEPDLAAAALTLTDELRATGDRRAALQVMERYVHDHPTCIECLQNIAADHFAFHELDAAAAAIDRVIAAGVSYLPSTGGSNFHPAEAQVLGGAIYEAKGDRERALRLYESALRLDPRAVEAHLGAGRLLLDQDPAASVAHLKQYHASRPGDLHAALLLARAEVAAGDEAGARSLLDQVRTQAARRAPARRRELELEVEMQLAELSVRHGDLDAARTRLDRVVASAPDYTPARTLLAELAHRSAPTP